MATVRRLIQQSFRSQIWQVEIPGQPTFVLKEFNIRSASSDQEMRLYEELSDITGVVKCLGCKFEEKPALMTEFCAIRSMRFYLSWIPEPVPETTLLDWYRSMSRTVSSLHNRRVAHKAIDATNWLLTDGMQVKLTDFGLAVRLAEVNEDRTQESPTDPFIEDALQLANVFYQMATCDLSTKVLSLPGTAVKRACAERGYGWRASNTICLLLLLRTLPIRVKLIKNSEDCKSHLRKKWRFLN